MLSTLSLFSSVPRSELRVLAQSSAVRQIEGGEFLSLPGEQPEIGFVVISGRLAVTKISEAGKELTVELLPPGDAFGILRVLESTPPNTAVRAQIASRILAVHQTALKIIVDRYPAVYREIAEEYSNRMKALLNLAVSLAHAKVESRIVSTLLALAPRFGKSCAQEDQSRIYLTRRELADLAGTTPETAIRITKNFERDGLLDLSRPGIIKILSLNNLREMITGN
jgi:CRP-like cAMP-binding protein